MIIFALVFTVAFFLMDDASYSRSHGNVLISVAIVAVACWLLALVSLLLWGVRFMGWWVHSPWVM
jgi:hypothetical protein